MSHMPIVSVVMPAYNAGHTIGDAIRSVLCQTCDDFELVICNDASTDRTVEVVRSFADRRIRLIENPENWGEGRTRDHAISVARGRWLSVLDADDAWTPRRLERLLVAVQGHGAVMVFDDIMECHHGPGGMVPWRRVRGREGLGAKDSEISVEFSTFIRERRLLIKPMFPRSLVQKGRLKHSARKFAADTEFFLRLVDVGSKMVYVPEPMYLYRLTPGSMTANPRRSELMLEVLEEAQRCMNLSFGERAALSEKIAQVTKDVEYGPVLRAVKARNWFRVAWLLAGDWGLLKEFGRRVGESVPYRVHRTLHRAKGRQ